jgi:hypothetical protein
MAQPNAPVSKTDATYEKSDGLCDDLHRGMMERDNWCTMTYTVLLLYALRAGVEGGGEGGAGCGHRMTLMFTWFIRVDLGRGWGFEGCRLPLAKLGVHDGFRV